MGLRIVIALVLGIAALPMTGFAATEFVRTLQEVIRAISLQKTADLDFGRTEAPAPALRLDPASSGTGPARFVVTGQPQTVYNVRLPAEITLRNQDSHTGSGLNTIVVRDFRTFPAPGYTVLDGAGRQNLAVGATRLALPQNQNPGRYEGTFTIIVCYSC